MEADVIERIFRIGQQSRLSFSNGDISTGDSYEEDGKHWFVGIDRDGREYVSDEMPAERLPITIVVHSDGARYITASE